MTESKSNFFNYPRQFLHYEVAFYGDGHHTVDRASRNENINHIFWLSFSSLLLKISFAIIKLSPFDIKMLNVHAYIKWDDEMGEDAEDKMDDVICIDKVVVKVQVHVKLNL